MADAKFRIAHGTEFPYHEEAPANKYEVAALGVLADLLDRKGIKWELDGVDLDVRKEIVQSLTSIIKEATQPKWRAFADEKPTELTEILWRVPIDPTKGGDVPDGYTHEVGIGWYHEEDAADWTGEWMPVLDLQ